MGRKQRFKSEKKCVWEIYKVLMTLGQERLKERETQGGLKPRKMG